MVLVIFIRSKKYKSIEIDGVNDRRNNACFCSLLFEVLILRIDRFTKVVR